MGTLKLWNSDSTYDDSGNISLAESIDVGMILACPYNDNGNSTISISVNNGTIFHQSGTGAPSYASSSQGYAAFVSGMNKGSVTITVSHPSSRSSSTNCQIALFKLSWSVIISFGFLHCYYWLSVIISFDT